MLTTASYYSKLADSTEQNPSSEACSFPPSHEPCLQKQANCLSSEPTGPPFCFLKLHLNMFFHLRLGLSNSLLPVGFSTKFLYVFLFSLTPHLSPSSLHLIGNDEIVNCNCVDTRWQQYSTRVHTNSTQNNTMKQNTQNGTCTVQHKNI